MGIIHRTQGMASSAAWAVTRRRRGITAIIPGWLLILLICWGAAVGLVPLWDEARRIQEPTATTVSALAREGVQGRHVTVRGFPIYSHLIWEGSSDSDPDRYLYALRAEHPKNGQFDLLFVESREDPRARTAQMLDLTGMLIGAEQRLREILEQNDSPQSRVLTTHFLRPGAKPASPSLVLTGAVALALLGAFILLGRCSMFTAFRPLPLAAEGAPVAPPTAEAPLQCLVTAKMQRGGQGRRVFVRNLPAELVPGLDDRGRPHGHFLVSRVPTAAAPVELELALPPGTQARSGVTCEGSALLPALHVKSSTGEAYLKFESAAHALAAQQAFTQS